jgi:hypothetical protein
MLEKERLSELVKVVFPFIGGKYAASVEVEKIAVEVI